MSDTIKVIKKDAQVAVKFGTAFIQKIQKVLVSLTSERTEEEIASLRKMLENKVTEFEEPWMETLIVLTVINTAIEEEAVKQGLTVDEVITQPES